MRTLSRARKMTCPDGIAGQVTYEDKRTENKRVAVHFLLLFFWGGVCVTLIRSARPPQQLLAYLVCSLQRFNYGTTDMSYGEGSP